MENKSLKSSDNSSSGNGSDIELIANKHRRSKNQISNNNTPLSIMNRQKNESSSSIKAYYQLSQFQQQQKQAMYVFQQQQIAIQQQPQQQRSLDKVPSDLRSSKQSFRMAMGNPCEFFVDVM